MLASQPYRQRCVLGGWSSGVEGGSGSESWRREGTETRGKDPKDSQFPAPKGALAALISTPSPPFKAPGRSKLFVNSFPALGPWAQPEGTPLCVSLKGHLRNKGSTPARC